MTHQTYENEMETIRIERANNVTHSLMHLMDRKDFDCTDAELALYIVTAIANERGTAALGELATAAAKELDARILVARTRAGSRA